MRTVKTFETEIVDYIDINGAATFGAVKLALRVLTKREREAFDQAFKNVFNNGDLRVIEKNTNIVSVYQLPA